MYRIRLYFSQNVPYQLLRTVFTTKENHPQGGDLICIRGKGESERGPSASFQWTLAVRGLSYLLVSHCGLKRSLQDFSESLDGNLDDEVPTETATLEGDLGSMASSLDYAISRQPLWIVDMFGLDVAGRPILRKLLHRWNSDRTKGGVVVLGVNRKVLRPEDVEVFLGSQRVDDPAAVRHLAAMLSPLPVKRTVASAKEKDPSPESGGEILAHLRRSFILEVSSMLRTTNVFNRKFLKTSAQRLASNSSFAGVVGKKGELERQFELSLSASNRLGLAGELGDAKAIINGEKPLRIVTAGTIAGTTVIFRYLTRFLNYGIDFSYQFASTNDIVDAILKRSFSTPPDACVLGVLPAAPLFTAHHQPDYSLVMMMPKASNRIIASGSSTLSRTFLSPEKGGSFIFCSDRPTSASFCFEELKREKVVSSKKVTVLHMEPHEVFAALKTDDRELRSILWFPHYQLNVIFNKCDIPTQPDMDLSLETLLFANQAMLRDRRRLSALCVAVRDAWLDLQGSEELIGRVVDDLLSDAEYLKYLYRISGVFQSEELNILSQGVSNGESKPKGRRSHA